MPYPIGRLLAFACERCFGLIGKEPPISRRSLEFFDTDNEFTIDRARNRLGYQPGYTLDQGLEETRSWLIGETGGKPDPRIHHESGIQPSASRH
jgi:nucleoside-diphosphate-sugar epimerase